VDCAANTAANLAAAGAATHQPALPLIVLTAIWTVMESEPAETVIESEPSRLEIVIATAPLNCRTKRQQNIIDTGAELNSCGSAFEPGASGLPHYCTSPVCVPDVIGELAAWWHSKQNKKNRRRSTYFWGLYRQTKNENGFTQVWPNFEVDIQSPRGFTYSPGREAK